MGETYLEARRDQQEAEAAFALENRVKHAMQNGRSALWELAEALYEFGEESGWAKLGYDSLRHWLADPEISMNHGTYNRLVKTYRKLVVEKQIDAGRLRQLDMSKVAIVTDKIAANEVLVDDALADVGSLAARDLREKYYGKPAKPEPVAEAVVAAVVETPIVVAGEVIEPYVEVVVDDVPIEPEIIEGTATDIASESVDNPLPTFAGYEFPGWVTQGTVQALLNEANQAVDSGASFPRVSRKPLQVAVELARAWLATNQS